MYNKYEKISSYFLVILMGITLLLLMCLGFYNHPTGDDYYYGTAVRRVIEENGSVLQMLSAAAKGVAEQYYCWQGTYSAMFLMHIPPNVFGENGYKLVTTIILSLYAGGVFYLLQPIVCTILKGSKYMWCAVSSVFVILTIQTVPFKGESFFWYNGSMYYTGYFSLALYFFGFMCKYLLTNKKSYLPALCFGAVFLAGGNYVSLLPTMLITLTIVVYLIKKASPKAWKIALIALLMIIGFFISATAPGNQVRGEGSIGNMSAVKAICVSVWQSMSYLEAWIDRWWLMTVIVLTPFFWQTYKNIDFSFPLPGVVVGFVHGVFCSMSCPTFYAQGSTGAARVVAIVYYGFMISTLLNYYYLLGYFYQWWKERGVIKQISLSEKKNSTGKMVPQILAVCVMLFLFGGQVYSGEFKKCSSIQALRLLKNGEAVAYEYEYRERLKVLQDETVRDVVFKPYEHQPAMLFVGDFTGDVNNPNNIEIANYFRKNSIKVDY